MPVGLVPDVHDTGRDDGPAKVKAGSVDDWDIDKKIAIISMLTEVVLLSCHSSRSRFLSASLSPFPVLVLPSYHPARFSPKLSREEVVEKLTYAPTCSPWLFPTPRPFTYFDITGLGVGQKLAHSGSMTAVLTPSTQLANQSLDNVYTNLGITTMTTPSTTAAGESAQAPKRVFSPGSATATTPKMASKPLSPASGGARTPRARAAALKSPNAGRAGTNEITDGVDDLQVKSPIVESPAAVPGSIDQVMADVNAPPVNAPTRKDTASTETNSSESGPNAPTALGSSYGPEGFPSGTNTTDEGEMTPMDLQMTAQAAMIVAQADEAIKQLNGTSSVIQGPPAVPNLNDPYALPRGYADFVNPQSRSESTDPEFNIHRQSSTSSSVTEASTSSEESDLCIPRIEWVNTTAKKVLSPGSANQYLNSPYGIGVGAQGQKGRSPVKMPPPNAAGGRRASAERPGLPGPQASLPLGATAHSPGGLNDAQGSALPAGTNPNAIAEDEDEERTVGKQDVSSSSSDEGMFMPSAGNNGGQEMSSAPSGEGKGKRKAEAVSHWRQGGVAGEEDKSGEESKRSSKKRRRSEINMEEIDPALRDADAPISMVPSMGVSGVSFNDEVREMDMDMNGASAGGPGSDAGNDSNSDYESVASLDSQQDPEYVGEPSSTKKSGVRSKATTGGSKKGKGRASTGTSMNGAGGSKGGKKARKSEGDKDGGGGGGGGGGAGGAGGSKKVSSALNPANVQCEYVNPLPPYNRCQDIFTRKYDLPRHMARHARREGELVYEGKLTEDKALLWKTIKDKPKVTCNSCGESFTRMDALKRHQTKQHHS